MKLSCMFKIHRRSGSSVWIDGASARSVCKDCGTPLVRVAPRTWIEVHQRMKHQYY